VDERPEREEGGEADPRGRPAAPGFPVFWPSVTRRVLTFAYPFAFALYLPLALFAANSEQQLLSSLTAPLLCCLLIAALASALANLSTRDARTASFRAFGLLACFFLSGQLRLLVPDHVPAFGWQAPVGALAQVAVALVAILLFRLRLERRGEVVTQSIGVFSFFLFAMGVCLVFFPSLAARTRLQAAGPPATAPLPPGIPPAASRPHVFYIVLDGYGREDVLRETFGFDNSAFLGDLRRRGFFVASRALSNYAQTLLSLASSLNMAYVRDLVPTEPANPKDRAPLTDAILRNRAMRLLDAAGYTSVAFSTGYSRGELRSADRFETHEFGPAADPFLQAFLELTPLAPLMRLWSQPGPADLHRARVLYTLEHCADFASSSSPAFVFAHVLSPHPPFLFDARGNVPTEVQPSWYTLFDGDHLRAASSISTEEYRRLYVDQLKFLNDRVVSLIDAILARANRPVVIVIQGDHGPGSGLYWEDPRQTDLRERMAILSAYRFPDGGQEGLRDDITPVNSFRLVLKRVLGFDLPQLPDHSYFSRNTTPYQELRVQAAPDGSLELAPGAGQSAISPPAPVSPGPSPASR